MVKSRSEEQRITKMTNLGVANRNLLGKARTWCKHLTVEMRTAGMIAEVTGLPIGSHEIRCPHASGGVAGMNLPVLLPQFVIEHCPKCPHHTPNGSVTWGEGVIRDAEVRATAEVGRRSQAEERLAALRARMLTLPRVAKSETDLTEHTILEWIEHIFGENSSTAEESERRLIEAALVAPELFQDAAVNALVEGAAIEPFGERCLPVLAGLAKRRPELDERLGGVARTAILEGRDLQSCCQILFDTLGRSDSEVAQDVVSEVSVRLNYIRPMGGWPRRDPEHPMVDIPPDYSSSTRLLVLAFDRQPASVLQPLREAFADNEKTRRINACGVVRSIFKHRPGIGIELLPDLVQSLELDDDMFDESADRTACSMLAEVFRYDPVAVDNLLSTRIVSRTEELQSLYVDVYQSVAAGQRWREQDDRSLGPASERQTVERAFQRCLAFLQDDRLGLEARCDVPRAIESVCEDHPDIAIAAFERLLGTIAILHTRDKPPEPPSRLFLPGDAEPSPGLVAVEARNRLQRWNIFRKAVRKALDELVGNRPDQTLPSLLSAFDKVPSKTADGFKSDLLTLIGRVGEHPHLRAAIMPALWKGLMDFDSPLVRASAIDALCQAFRAEHATPPSDIVNTLLIHLRDNYKIVHTAAIRAIGGNTNWLSEEQSEESLNLIYAWAVTYKPKEPWRLEPIVDAMLSVSGQVQGSREAVVKAVVDLLPTSNPHASDELLDLLTRRVGAHEPAGVAVAPHVARRIAISRRDTFDYHENQRQVEQFTWLYGLTGAAFGQLENVLSEIARTAVKKDPRAGCLFASLFGAFGRHTIESELLGAVDAALPSGRQNDPLKAIVTQLRDAAEHNRCLASS